MIKVSHINVWGFEHAIRGMRNPMNSWDKSDSDFTAEGLQIGENDLALMHKLCVGGQPHRKYLRQIMISLDIEAPLYWWKEFDTYKIGVTADSCSTMHKIHEKEFTIDDFSHEHLLQVAEDSLMGTIDTLNEYRVFFLETKDKKYWWQMIQLLPSSYNQKRTITMNYENALNMIEWRETHKLDEWRDFVKMLKCLPYIKEIIEED